LKQVKIKFIPRWVVVILLMCIGIVGILPLISAIDQYLDSQTITVKSSLTVLGGLGFSALIWKLLFTWSDKIVFMGEHSRAEVKAELEKSRNATGCFSFFDDRFEYINTGDEQKEIRWADIVRITVYKRERWADDQINLIFLIKNDIIFRIDEDVPGWYLLIRNLKKHIDFTVKPWELLAASFALPDEGLLIYEAEN
jgi:hypothetical protein